MTESVQSERTSDNQLEEVESAAAVWEVQERHTALIPSRTSCITLVGPSEHHRIITFKRVFSALRTSTSLLPRGRVLHLAQSGCADQSILTRWLAIGIAYATQHWTRICSGYG